MDGFQNRSGPRDGLDDFPTPPWATRAFIEHGLPGDIDGYKDLTVWEPCANRGHMVFPMQEYFGTVIGTDIHDYGAGFPVVDFLNGPTPADHGMDVDMILTNPPFNKAVDFFHRWNRDMKQVQYFGLLLRMSWMEGVGRYNDIFEKNAPSVICPFAQRVPIVAGRLHRKAVSQMPYAWFFWNREKSVHSPTRVNWIPPCKAKYDRDEDWPAEENADV